MSYAAYWEQRRRKGARDRDRLAHLVSEGCSVAAAGRELGISQQAASKQWAIIRAGLGPQAV